MAIPRYKDIVELVKKGSTVEAQEKIMELREAAIELQEENLALREELAKLRAEMKRKQELVFRNGVYYLPNGDHEDGPFCSKCHDADGKQIRLHEFNHYLAGEQWVCKNCNSDYVRTNV
ncbi:hypothetical protein [Vibrio parahaemolyticus]|uniref:hypothetical protein n=1 Tax=Vibrio parahaemolyticus TaxID=670 RepID=UPI0027E4B8A7|nr:hypothetical protein [Vibrio parahaemolyticus]WMN84086.1 hypothetical protein NI384_06160 [Vibrio parahaemolyticus]